MSHRGSHALRLAVVLFACGVALPPLSRAEGQGKGSAGEASPPVLALKAARLFDGRSDHWVRDGVVVVAGGKIQAAGAGVAVPAGAQTIDLGDVTLMPGLIDCHVHLSFEASDDYNRDAITRLRRDVAESAIRATANARHTLMAGFTTVRDLGSSDFIDVGLRNAIRDGVIPGPRMLVSVHMLGARGGHADGAGFAYRQLGEEPGFERGIASGPDQFRDAVRFAVKYGADVIKVGATGGVLSLSDEVDTPQVTQAEMDALVDEAHRLHKRAAAHAHGVTGAKEAIRAGIDSIEHGSFLDEEGLRMMKERGTWLVPTLLAGEYASGRVVPRHYPPEIAAKAAAAVAQRSAMFRNALRMGVKIAFGTDSAVSPHGLNAKEFKLLVDHGMAPAAALRSAMDAAADLLGLPGQIGTLEAGKQADLVAVPGDPLADIRVTERVSFVMKGGQIWKTGGVEK
ncbi:MAG TPA: amidohydrolase family protein [Thermoanaerobaculia bacterium]|nr:amidohydrolase family protein [Thermoanaerobaculia bacterium]